jgi:DNA-binding MarR family transcriptional regulator
MPQTKQQSILDPNEVKTCACFNLRKASRAITQCYDEAFRSLGLKVTQVGLLNAVNRLGPVTVSSLAEIIVMDRTTLSRNIRPLEDQGFIHTEPGEDRRERVLSLTKKGKGLVEKAYPLWKDVQGRIAKQFGKQRLECLMVELSDFCEIARKK